MISMTIIFWRQHPAGLMAISMMCGGDGLADIIGRRFGSSKLPWNSNKSWAGSAAMFFGGMAMAGGFVWLYCTLGYFDCLKAQFMLPYIAAVCLASTLVESLPINQWLDDNLSVPGVAVAVSYLMLPYVAAASHGCAVDAHLLLPQTLKL
jgi:phytol kinase